MKLPHLPTLDEIGAAPEVHCWRLRRETDREYAHRLALHLQVRIIELEGNINDFENLLAATLAIKVNPNLREQP